ncbi:unnamed protein product [Caenorhabditis bovis]|uniref:Uncharacterized protein n=1 Tax=Caenorhabditis bovis TaxID=2654633 RepID=A0A8S1EDT1_9PELO|nr:unnamed protein product [Caenorhabditis bovis]
MLCASEKRLNITEMCSAATFNVRFMTFLNSTVIRCEGLGTIIEAFLIVEIALLALGILEFLYLFYLFLFVRSMHFNLTCLFMHYGGQYFFSVMARCVILYQQFGFHIPDEYLFYANYIRTICLFIAFYILPIFMVERLFATIMVKTYEKSRHFWVSLVILAIFFPLVITSGVAYINCWISLPIHVATFIIVNLTGYFGLVAIYNYNSKRHQKTLKLPKNRNYNLSERFQLAENIKMCEVLRRVQISIIFFNVFSTSILLLDHFPISPRFLSLAYVFYNILLTIYAISCPIILHQCLPEWCKNTRKLIKLILGNRINEVRPRTTFGEKMIYDNHRDLTNMYFMQFDKALR